MTAPGLKGRQWQRLRAEVIATAPPICYLCGKPVDTTLSGRHPLGPSIDHVQPRARGGAKWNRSNLRLTHLRCNSAKGDRTPVKRIRSRNW